MRHCRLAEGLWATPRVSAGAVSPQVRRFRSRGLPAITNGIINIVAWDNGGGISREIDLLSRVSAQQGWQVAYNGSRRRTPSRRFVSRASRRLRREWQLFGTRLGVFRLPYAANLFIEQIAHPFIPLGRVNVLLPHAEWFRPNSAPLLYQMDWVFILTFHAQPIFESLGCHVRYLGFPVPIAVLAASRGRAPRARCISRARTSGRGPKRFWTPGPDIRSGRSFTCCAVPAVLTAGHFRGPIGCAPRTST